MDILVGQFDLQNPTEVWGLENYKAADILVRNGQLPLGWIFPRGKHSGVLTREELLELAAENGFVADRESVEFRLTHEPGITVIVCTRDRPVTLKRCLDSLRCLRYQNLEVIVVDNASTTSETKELVARTPFRYVREDQPGLDWARNTGLHAAGNEIVAYTDDDAKVDPHWLQGIVSGFEDPSVACVTGLVCPLELATLAQAIFELNKGMGKGFRPRLFQPAAMAPEQLVAAHNAGVGANMAFRRDVLSRLGGFDVHLDVGTPANGGGDIDMFHRILASGQAIWYEPRALVWHQHRRSLPGLHKQFYDNGRSFGCYLLKAASNRTVPRTAVVRFAFGRWLAGWLIGSVAKREPGRRPLLAIAEACGALSAPWAYWKTYRRLPLFSSVQ